MRLVIFNGVDSTAGATLITGVNVVQDDQFVSVVGLPPTIDNVDWVSAFATVHAPFGGANVVPTGGIIQAAGHNFSGRAFVALITGA